MSLKQAFHEARQLVDSVLGTEQVFRPTERIFVKEPLHIPLRVIPYDHQKAFEQDVWEISQMLNEKGQYWCDGQWKSEPRLIALEMLHSGICWVSTSKVKRAQRVVLKRGK